MKVAIRVDQNLDPVLPIASFDLELFSRQRNEDDAKILGQYPVVVGDVNRFGERHPPGLVLG